MRQGRQAECARACGPGPLIRLLFESSLDFVDDEISVAWLGPAPAHANDAFAGLHALGEGLGCRGRGTVASEVGVILGAEAFDDVGACGLVGGVAQDEWIAEDAVLAIDIDGDLARLGLAWSARALVSEADISIGFATVVFRGGVGEGAGRNGTPARGGGGQGGADCEGHCLSVAGVEAVQGRGCRIVLNPLPVSARLRRGGGGKKKSMRAVRAQRSEPRAVLILLAVTGGEETLDTPHEVREPGRLRAQYAGERDNGDEVEAKVLGRHRDGKGGETTRSIRTALDPGRG